MKTITRKQFTKLFTSKESISASQTIDVLDALEQDDDGPVSLYEPHQRESFQSLRNLCEKLLPLVNYLDEAGNKGTCTLKEMVTSQYDSEGETTVEPSEMKSLKKIKVGQTVRLNGWMGMFTDVTRVS